MEYRGFVIDRTQTGYRVCRGENTDIHTHLKNKNACLKLIDNVIEHRIPKRCSFYTIECHIRLADDENYKRHLEEYLEVRRHKGKQVYRNVNRGLKGD